MIAILDYGLGNIRAFANVYKRLNLPHQIAGTAGELKGATKIILPGVGAFEHAMERLDGSGLRDSVNELVVERKIPLLGICVGMQMLAFSSEEGRRPGLGWVPGVVKKFDVSGLTGRVQLPHMGWNNVAPTPACPLFAGIDANSRFYFLHSYYFQCKRDDCTAAVTDYGGPFSSAVAYGNVYGVQFHPEKSHQCGVRLLKNFGEL